MQVWMAKTPPDLTAVTAGVSQTCGRRSAPSSTSGLDAMAEVARTDRLGTGRTGMVHRMERPIGLQRACRAPGGPHGRIPALGTGRGTLGVPVLFDAGRSP